MESRLKERLTGAAILVALIVLVVPEIFHDRRGAPTPPSVASGTPPGASAVPVRAYTIELAPHPAAATQPPAEPAQPPAERVPPPAERVPPPAQRVRPAAGAAHPGAVEHPPAPDAPAKARMAGGWTVQLGLFAKSANAERLAHTAQSHGFGVQISRFGPRGLYRVAVAGIADRAAAEQLSRRLHGAGLPAAILGPR